MKHGPILGLDMSLVSPGISLYTTDNKWIFGGFSPYKSTRYREGCTIYPKIPSNSSSNITRYMYICDRIIQFIEKNIDQIEIPLINVIIEGYAFCPRRQGSSYKLHELGGVLQYCLTKVGIRHIYTIQPSSWKRVLQIHRSHKKSSFDYCRTHVPSFSTLTNKDKQCCHPYEDIADATCLVFWYAIKHKTGPQPGPVS